MMDAIEDYLAVRRAAGFDLLNADYLLRSFAHYAAAKNEMHIRAQTAIDWAVRGPSVEQRDERLKTVCRFARHIRLEDDRHELPPANHFGYAKKRRVPPHIFTPGEINCLIEAALDLPPAGALRSQTYATLLALLAVTGLRISEALRVSATSMPSNTATLASPNVGHCWSAFAWSSVRDTEVPRCGLYSA